MYYNKETRNEAGVYYRRGDWGTERGEGKPNFTTVVPPELSLKYSVPCDWNEGAELWELKIDESDTIFEYEGVYYKAFQSDIDMWNRGKVFQEMYQFSECNTYDAYGQKHTVTAEVFEILYKMAAVKYATAYEKSKL